jgi:membrane protein involved in colicin uptake
MTSSSGNSSTVILATALGSACACGAYLWGLSQQQRREQKEEQFATRAQHFTEELNELREDLAATQRKLHLEACERENAQQLLKIEKEARESAQSLVKQASEPQACEAAAGETRGNNSDNCKDCQADFTLFRRQILCAYCHCAFCNKCAPKRPTFEDQRQCLRCFVHNTENEHKKARIEADTQVLKAKYAQADAEFRLKQQVKDAQQAEESTCIVCMDAPRQALMLPCKHMCCCNECADIMLERQEKHCPICRADLTDIMRDVYC